MPDWIARKFRKEEERLLAVLKEHHVAIHRPEDVVPKPDESLGLGQMYARDPIISVGNITLNSQLQIPMRRKENRGFENLLKALSEQGVRVETLREEDAFLEGGDVIVDFPYIFVGQSKYGSSQKGMDWLKKIVGDKFQIVQVEITDPSVLHLDCAMTIIGNKTAIIHRKSLTENLPEPLNSYDFINLWIGQSIIQFSEQSVADIIKNLIEKVEQMYC